MEFKYLIGICIINSQRLDNNRHQSQTGASKGVLFFIFHITGCWEHQAGAGNTNQGEEFLLCFLSTSRRELAINVDFLRGFYYLSFFLTHLSAFVVAKYIRSVPQPSPAILYSLSPIQFHL